MVASLIFNVSILGQWIGMINEPAMTEKYPIDDPHELGHVVLLVSGKTERVWYGEFLRRTLETLTGASV